MSRHRDAWAIVVLVSAGLAGGVTIAVLNPSWPVAFLAALAVGLLVGAVVRHWLRRP
jgi:glycerol uptake facilitator-like aquaporin